MARPLKNTVDYCSLDAYPGKTIFILESKFKNDGSAVWYKTLQLLCRSENHFYDCGKPAEWQYIVALMLCPESLTTEIYDTLAEVEAIDKDLWQQRKIIWCQNLVNRLAEVYAERKRPLPQKPVIVEGYPSEKPQGLAVIAGDNRQSKVNQIKENVTPTPFLQTPPRERPKSCHGFKTIGDVIRDNSDLFDGKGPRDGVHIAPP